MRKLTIYDKNFWQDWNYLANKGYFCNLVNLFIKNLNAPNVSNHFKNE